MMMVLDRVQVMLRRCERAKRGTEVGTHEQQRLDNVAIAFGRPLALAFGPLTLAGVVVVLDLRNG